MKAMPQPGRWQVRCPPFQLPTLMVPSMISRVGHMVPERNVPRTVICRGSPGCGRFFPVKKKPPLPDRRSRHAPTFATQPVAVTLFFDAAVASLPKRINAQPSNAMVLMEAPKMLLNHGPTCGNAAEALPVRAAEDTAPRSYFRRTRARRVLHASALAGLRVPLHASDTKRARNAASKSCALCRKSAEKRTNSVLLSPVSFAVPAAESKLFLARRSRRCDHREGGKGFLPLVPSPWEKVECRAKASGGGGSCAREASASAWG